MSGVAIFAVLVIVFAIVVVSGAGGLVGAGGATDVLLRHTVVAMGVALL